MFNVPINHNFGLRPVLFAIGKIEIPSYPIMIILAVVAGLIVFALNIKKEKNRDNIYWLFIAAFFGGTIGAKIPMLIRNFDTLLNSRDIYSALSGRTVVGGLVGGIIAAIWTRKKLGIKKRFGNQFVPAVALAIAIGRVGCLLQGCCFGKTSKVAWAIDFGDGVKRHPTQIYEIIFFLTWFVLSLSLNKKDKMKEGILFQFFILTYFIFRFLIEYIREEPVFICNLTLAQIASILIVLYYSISLVLKEVSWTKK